MDAWESVKELIHKTIQHLLEQQGKDTNHHYYCKQHKQLAAQDLEALSHALESLSAKNASLHALLLLSDAEGAEYADEVAALTNATTHAAEKRAAQAAEANKTLVETKAAIAAVKAAKADLEDFYKGQPGGVVRLASVVDLLDGLAIRLQKTVDVVEAGEAEDRAAFVQLDRARRVALATAETGERNAAGDVVDAEAALAGTPERMANLSAKKSATEHRATELDLLCADPPAATQEVNALKEYLASDVFSLLAVGRRASQAAAKSAAAARSKRAE